MLTTHNPEKVLENIAFIIQENITEFDTHPHESKMLLKQGSYAQQG